MVLRSVDQKLTSSVSLYGEKSRLHCILEFVKYYHMGNIDCRARFLGSALGSVTHWSSNWHLLHPAHCPVLRV